jgi:enamine deaminase RidA (YjgF/YER057c/UK114 family)
MTRQLRRFNDGSSWQEIGGYSRAVRRDNSIMVSGTTANGPSGEAMFAGDTYRQTVHAIGLAITAIEQLGGTVHDIVRTRVLLAPEASWEEAAEAHRSCLSAVLPANSMYYVASLIGLDYLVEIEADAVVQA